MDYQVSARKYRPGTFQDVIGQAHVVQTLMNAVATKRIAHAFLFSGTRGVGKTTVARILAKSLNCEKVERGNPCNTCGNCVDIIQGQSVDVIEIDGASNTSVDDIREIREHVKFAPFRGRYRVYIIDEVHMLSNSAFNALLKTLEEPPAHVVFVFATTEVHKIPATILSRCQHYHFKRIARSEIVGCLYNVANEEGISIAERSLVALARASEGSMRDALSLFDQVIAFSGKDIRHEDLEVLLGAVPQEHVDALVSAMAKTDGAAAVRVVADVLDQGHDLRMFCREVVEYIRHMLVASVVTSLHDLRGLIEKSDDELAVVVKTAKAFSTTHLQALFTVWSQAEDGLRMTSHPRFLIEVAAIKAASGGGRPEASTRSGGDENAKRGPSETLIRPGQKGEGANSIIPSPSRPATVKNSPSPKAHDHAPPRSVPPSSLSPRETPSVSRGAKNSDPGVGDSGIAAVPGEPPPPAKAVAFFDWERVQDHVGSSLPSVGSFLERSVLVNVEDEWVTIGYSKSETVARGVVEKRDNLNAVSVVCAKVAGRPIKVRVVELSVGQPMGISRAQRRATEAQDQRLALLEHTRSHPVVKQALQMFGGDVVEVREGSSRKEA